MDMFQNPTGGSRNQVYQKSSLNILKLANTNNSVINLIGKQTENSLLLKKQSSNQFLNKEENNQSQRKEELNQMKFIEILDKEQQKIRNDKMQIEEEEIQRFEEKFIENLKMSKQKDFQEQNQQLEIKNSQMNEMNNNHNQEEQKQKNYQIQKINVFQEQEKTIINSQNLQEKNENKEKQNQEEIQCFSEDKDFNKVSEQQERKKRIIKKKEVLNKIQQEEEQLSEKEQNEVNSDDEIKKKKRVRKNQKKEKNENLEKKRSQSVQQQLQQNPDELVKKEVKEKKKLKKQKQVNVNLVRLDLKKKYKSDAVTGERKQLRMKFTKNGQLKQNKNQQKYKKFAKIVDQVEENEVKSLLKNVEFTKPKARNAFELVEEIQEMKYAKSNMYLNCLSSGLQVQIMDLDQDQDLEKRDQREQENDNKSEDQGLGFKEIQWEEGEVNEKMQNQFLVQILKKIFGFNEFRWGQLETIKNILKRKSTLALFSTGHGKSLTYQIPAYLMPGITVVISPLLSLMMDQISKLPKQITGVSLNSTLNYQEKDKIINMIRLQQVKILYVSPETLQIGLAGLLGFQPQINFICIDEAHCVSEWSHNFRTSYLIIEKLIHEQFGESVPILALTATATKQTQQSVCGHLRINDLIKLPSVVRKNLLISVSIEQSGDQNVQILNLLQSEKFRFLSGVIIYCQTKYETESLCNFLNNSNVQAFSYHSGKEEAQRTYIQQGFMEGKIKIVVATIAFGMGIDKSDIRAVIHYSLPKTMENLVQEIGRAGRDGKESYCHLILNDNDFFRSRGWVFTEMVELEQLYELKEKIILSVQQQSVENLKKNKKRKNIDSDSENENLLPKICWDEIDFQNNQHIYYLNLNQLNKIFDSKKEGIITWMIKIGQKSQGKIKVLSPSWENCTLKFYKYKPEDILEGKILFKEEGFEKTQDLEMLKQIILRSKKCSGNYNFNFIQECNFRGILPHEMVKKLKKFYSYFYVSAEFKENVVCWQFLESITETEFDQILKLTFQELKEYEKSMLQKIDFIYLVAKECAQGNISVMIKNQLFGKKGNRNFNDYLDRYFEKQDTNFLDLLSFDGIDVLNEMPYRKIENQDEVQIKEFTIRFLRNEIEQMKKNKEEKWKIKQIQSTKVITRIFQGISSETFSYLDWNKNPMWGKFKDFKFEDLRDCIQLILQQNFQKKNKQIKQQSIEVFQQDPEEFQENSNQMIIID